MNNTKPISLVTGANKGIGLETAKQLAALGHHVILAARDRSKAVEAAKSLGGEVEPLQLDVTDAASISAAVAVIAQKHGRLDVLINNAGVLLDAADQPPSAQSLDTWRKTFDTNVFGLIAVTQAFLPLLKKSTGARIVNLSSILGSNALHQQKDSGIYDYKVPAYNVSKSAVNAWTVHLAYELRDTPHKVNAAHPGHVQTDMGGAAAPMSIPDGAKTSVWLATLPADGPNGGYFHQGETLPW